MEIKYSHDKFEFQELYAFKPGMIRILSIIFQPDEVTRAEDITLNFSFQEFIQFCLFLDINPSNMILSNNFTNSQI